MVNAAAIATLVSIAGPGRVAVGIGSGFTGRLTMGRRPMKWSDVGQYVRVLRALLRGEEAEWEGGAIRMLHPEGYGASRPIDVPFVIGAAGPKGIAVAHELGDGVFGPACRCAASGGVSCVTLAPWLVTVRHPDRRPSLPPPATPRQ